MQIDSSLWAVPTPQLADRLYTSLQNGEKVRIAVCFLQYGLLCVRLLLLVAMGGVGGRWREVQPTSCAKASVVVCAPLLEAKRSHFGNVPVDELCVVTQASALPL